jgi:Right handed beta helix region
MKAFQSGLMRLTLGRPLNRSTNSYEKPQSRFERHCAISLPILCLFSLTSFAETINLKPGENVAAVVASAPESTSFVFASGTYRLQQISPKKGDSFAGPATGVALLDGAQPITFSPVSGSSPALWEATIGSNPLDTGGCATGHSLCHYTRELFAGSALLMPVASTAQLTSSTWFYDSSHKTAVINFNPGTKSFEIGTSTCAFCGYASNVTIKNLTVERYASPSTTGAIGQAGSGTYWTVSNVEGRYNHGGAVQIGANGIVENSYLHHNGQKGLGGGGANLQIVNNELAYNNYDWFDFGWEAGGAKFGDLDTAAILNNYVHDNLGTGIWDDANSIYVHYKGNRIENNAGSGIQHEIGYSAVIENNTINRNGATPRISMWDGQISVQNSTNTTVQNNTIIVAADYGSGLVIVNQDRGYGTYGAHLGAHDTIEKNVITYEGTDGAGGIMGIASTGIGNIIDNNTYHITVGLDKHHFEAFGVKTFQQFQAAGFDVHSKIVWKAAP